MDRGPAVTPAGALAPYVTWKMSHPGYPPHDALCQHGAGGLEGQEENTLGDKGLASPDPALMGRVTGSRLFSQRPKGLGQVMPVRL